MAMDKLFKGILQVTETSFKTMSDNDKLGHIIFVRKDTSKNDGDGAEVWFGKKRYGRVEATRLAEIESSIETLGGRVTDIETTLGDFTAQLTGDLKTVAAVVANHESRLDTAEGKITTIETLLGADGEIGGEINDIREFAEQVSDSVDSVVNDIIGEISEGTTVASEIARVEGLANAAQDGVDAIVADYLNSTDKTELEDKITAAESAAKSYAKDAVEKAHEHTNKSELDKIANGDKAKWDGHVANADIHVTKDEKDRWTAAAQDVEDFFNGALEDGAEQVKDTLREIQEYITSDASAAATMAENITKAQNAADKAQGEVDALKIAVGAGFSEGKTVASEITRVEGIANAAVQSVSVADGCEMLSATKVDTTVTLALYYGGDDAE